MHTDRYAEHSHSVTYPVFRQLPQWSSTALNRWIVQWAKERAVRYREWLKTHPQDLPEPRLYKEELRVLYLSSRWALLSIVIRYEDTEELISGGIIFNLAEGKANPLTLEDLFKPDASARQRLAELCREELKKTRAVQAWMGVDIVTPKSLPFPIIGPAGLDFLLFSEPGPEESLHLLGAPEPSILVRIPYDAVSKILRPDGPTAEFYR
jgi:hypothetical protein